MEAYLVRMGNPVTACDEKNSLFAPLPEETKERDEQRDASEQVGEAFAQRKIHTGDAPQAIHKAAQAQQGRHPDDDAHEHIKPERIAALSARLVNDAVEENAHHREQ